MVSVTNKSPSELLDKLKKEYGSFFMIEDNIKFEAEYKSFIENKLMVEKLLPTFKDEIKQVNYEDGCKVYFEDGWIICRFSGTEPLLRIFAESTSKERALEYVKVFKDFLF
jgi:phosphomannomutase